MGERKKDARITIRVTKEEKEGIEKAARENGYSNASSFIVDRCYRNVGRDNKAIVNKEAITHLIKLSDMTNSLVGEARCQGLSEELCDFIYDMKSEVKYTWQSLR